MLKKILILFVLISLNSTFIFCQNLVPNSSFEDTIKCPDWWGQINFAKYWYSSSPSATPDYFNSCNENDFSVPNNICGFSYAKDGKAYAGILTYYYTYNKREFIQVPLINLLIKDNNYKVTFYIKFMERSMYATNSIGCLLTKQPKILTDSFMYFNPQVNYLDTILDDTANWVKFEGVFIAKGNEKYLSIGNFIPDGMLSISLVKPNAIESVAAYYIDDVSLINLSPDTIDTTDTTNLVQFFNVYPSLANELFYLDYSNIEINKTHFLLFDVCGRKVREIYLSVPKAKQSVDVSNLESGMYFYSLQIDGGVKQKGKIVIVR